MNTKFDFEYIKTNNVSGWEEQWYRLIDGRWIVENNELVEDKKAFIFILGMSVAEVSLAIGHSGYTKRELEWYQSQSDRFTLINGKYVQNSGWDQEYLANKLSDAIDKKLTEIDLAVKVKLQEPFKFNGNTFYPDVESIQGQFVGLSLLPTDYFIEWKTADKVGLQNIYVTLDKSGIAGLAMALLAYRANIWNDGDALKKQVKEFATIEDVENFVTVI